MKTVSKFGSEEKEGKVIPDFVENFSAEEEPKPDFFTPEKQKNSRNPLFPLCFRNLGVPKRDPFLTFLLACFPWS